MYQLLTVLSNISMGQGGRDDYKLRALRLLGLVTYTIDDKHDAVQNIHIDANFCVPNSFIQGIVGYLGPNTVFDTIELDCFFSPVI